jgi:hypothetical protein
MLVAWCLLVKQYMGPICQHCYELIVGNAYRVTSKEEGITMLDLVVCYSCFMEAKRLHLHAEKIRARSKQLVAH